MTPEDSHLLIRQLISGDPAAAGQILARATTSTEPLVLTAAALLEPGTPSTCALRSASPQRTEIVCGDVNAYLAVLAEGTLVVSLLAGEQRTEVKRVPVFGDVLAVKMLVLPGSKL